MSLSFTPPFNAGFTTTPAVISPPFTDTSYSPPSTSDSSSSSIIIVIIIIASAVIVSASIYLLLRFLSKRFHRSFRTFSAADDVVSPTGHVASNDLLDSLPIFTYQSVTGNLTNGGDCAVCLSKFEPHDRLRLLPLCCHAFHAECIDTWIVSNQTCPLCRSTVLPVDCDALNKILNSDNSNSFRIEIGNISRRSNSATAADAAAAEGTGRSYSIGSFDYIVDDNGYEVSIGSIHSARGVSECDKESSVGIPISGEALAAEVGGGRNWLREYVDRLANSVSISSRTMSFRSSGRFFTGSSRRTEPIAVAADDLEANRVGEEISELFRWLSGV